MEIKINKKGDVTIIKVIKRLDASNYKIFKEKIHSFSKEDIYFVLDFSELEFLDSTGLGAIISSLKYASEKGGDVYIANLQPKPKMLFEITRAYKIFNVFDSVKAAINNFHN